MKLAASLAVVFSLVVLSWAQTFNPAHVSEDANWVMHANVERMFASVLGQTVRARLEKDIDREARDFLALLKLNLFEDISWATAYGTVKENMEPSGVVLLRGRFDRNHLETLLSAREEHRSHSHNGATIHQWVPQELGDGDDPMFGAFHEDRLLLTGSDLNAVKAGLNVLAGRSGALEDGDLARGLQAHDPSVYFSLASALPQSDAAAAGGMGIMGLDQVKSLRLALGETARAVRLNIAIGAKDLEAAEQIHGGLQGLRGMIQMQAAAEPDMARMLNALTIRQVDSNVNIQWSMPIDEALAAMQALQAKQKAAPRP